MSDSAISGRRAHRVRGCRNSFRANTVLPAPINDILVTRGGYRPAAASLFAADAVVQHQERQAEHPEGMGGTQFVVLDVHIQVLGEPCTASAVSCSVSGSMYAG